MHIILVAIAWIYVVVMVAAAEAVAPNGTLLGAAFTIVLWGVLPLSVVLYILTTPARRRARLQRETLRGSSGAPDGGHHAAGDPVPPVGKEP